jgi:hypothetical protein
MGGGGVATAKIIADRKESIIRLSNFSKDDVVSLYFNPLSTPTKEKFESADEPEDVYDTLEDEDEEEIGKAATVS